MPNLNAEAHFSQSPLGVDIQRSVFDRSFNHKMTFDPGKLNVLMADEILPGDDVAIKVSELVRAATPLVPVADDCFLDLFAFFEPYRLDWIHWKEFNGENNASAWINPVNYSVPSLSAFGSFRTVGDAAHQMGIPPITTSSNREYAKVHMLEFRGLRRIFNDWFRDQNTQAPKLINTGDTETDTSLFALPDVDRVHDYFGSALPGPQKGAAVKIALSGFMNVYPTSDSSKNFNVVNNASVVSTGGILWQTNLGSNIASGAMIGAAGASNNGNSGTQNGGNPSNARSIPVNLIADCEHVSSDFGIDVNALRLAVQTQRILEKLSIGGSRYTEFIRSMFGVISPDARQQRPELLGHHRVRIRMTDVPQSGATVSGSTPLGSVGAFSKTIDNNFMFSKAFTEHGTLFILYTVRHVRSYSQGIPKQFMRKTFGDFYLPALAHLGEMPIFMSQIYADGSTVADDDLFGWQEAWAELRYMPNRNSGYMDPAVANTIGDVWTYGDVYSQAPTLSDSWMQEGKAEISRTVAVPSEPLFIGDFYVDYKHTRCMPVYSVPGLVDHF